MRAGKHPLFCIGFSHKEFLDPKIRLIKHFFSHDKVNLGKVYSTIKHIQASEGEPAELPTAIHLVCTLHVLGLRFFCKIYRTGWIPFWSWQTLFPNKQQFSCYNFSSFTRQKDWELTSKHFSSNWLQIRSNDTLLWEYTFLPLPDWTWLC